MDCSTGSGHSFAGLACRQRNKIGFSQHAFLPDQSCVSRRRNIGSIAKFIFHFSVPYSDSIYDFRCGRILPSKQSLKPVDEITRTARKITAAKLKERIQVANSKDEIGRLAETLNDMISRLEASFEEVTQFSMDASHELRTPLTIMRGEIELALRADQTAVTYKETLASLLEEVVRMTSIIEGLILLAKADKGIEKIKKKPMRLDVLVNEIKEDAEVLAEQKRIDVSISKLDEATILGDEIRLRQLILNLITNAINYTQEGGKVTLSLERNNGDVKFIVEDTGIGIPKNRLK